MTDTSDKDLDEYEHIRQIIEAPMRSKISTSDVAVNMMSSTGLSEKISDILAWHNHKLAEARIDELGSVQFEYGHQLVQTNRDGRWLSLRERYKELNKSVKGE